MSLLLVGPSLAQDGVAQPDLLTGPAREAFELLADDTSLDNVSLIVQASADNGSWMFQLTDTGLQKSNTSERRSVFGELPPTSDLFLPQGVRVMLSVTARDTIYPFIIPGLNIKTDAIPGRLESVAIDTSQSGSFRSQCDSSCGQHSEDQSFAVHILTRAAFAKWLEAEKADQGTKE
ncbi:MAG: hypothetical protein ABJO38_20820 [Stappiaceae bacterium]